MAPVALSLALLGCGDSTATTDTTNSEPDGVASELAFGGMDTTFCRERPAYDAAGAGHLDSLTFFSVAQPVLTSSSNPSVVDLGDEYRETILSLAGEGHPWTVESEGFEWLELTGVFEPEFEGEAAVDPNDGDATVLMPSWTATNMPDDLDEIIVGLDRGAGSPGGVFPAADLTFVRTEGEERLRLMDPCDGFYVMTLVSGFDGSSISRGDLLEAVSAP
jgi:hypothetical protein